MYALNAHIVHNTLIKADIFAEISAEISAEFL